MSRVIRRLVALALVLFGALVGLAPAFAASGPSVVVVPISGTIDDGMAHLVDRAIVEAHERGSRAVVLEVNTFGGLVSSATEMRDAIEHADVPVYAYVSERAWSAGALVTLAASRISMAPGSSIGAAEPIPKTVKTVSALRAEFESTAARNHRNPEIAGAMVDSTLDLPVYKAYGTILTLTADAARRARITDNVEPTLTAALASFGLANATTTRAHYSLGERLARFATNPEISGFLLTLGFLGLLIEMQTMHGIAGTLGVAALGLFFGTHVYSGFSNGFVIALALAGVIGILFELHVLPGHGIAGTFGVLALVAAVLLAFGIPFLFVGVQALAIAIVSTALLFAFATRIFPENAFLHRLTFHGVQGGEYVTSDDHRALLGHTGFAASYLRPAGVATIDGQRVDVLTEGEFVTAGSHVRVTRVEGARIFVRPLDGG